MLKHLIAATLSAGLVAGLTVPAAQASVNDVRVLTHNVYFPSGAWRLVPMPGTQQRAALIAQADYVKGYDVVVFNELFESHPTKRWATNILLQDIANQYPYQTPVIASDTNKEQWNETRGWIDGTKMNGGVAIVSKWPIEEKIQQLYSVSPCGEDTSGNKGFAYAKINMQGEKLHVIGTHLQSESNGCGGTPAGRNVRNAQLGEIQAFIAGKNIPASEPVIIAGDMNVKKVADEYATMLDTLHAYGPAYTGHAFSWDATQNDLAARQYPGYAPEHLDYLLLSKDHYQIPGWTNKTITPSSFPNTWQDEIGLPYYRHYESDEYSDHFPVAAFGSGATEPEYNVRQKQYTNIRLKSVSEGKYLGLSNNSDGWLKASHSAPGWQTDFQIESWGLEYSDPYCLASNNYKVPGGWPGAFIKLKANDNNRYMNYCTSCGDGDYGYYAATTPSEKLYMVKTNGAGCLQNGDTVALGDFGGSFWYYVSVWPSGSWKGIPFLWDRSIDNDNKFTIEIDNN